MLKEFKKFIMRGNVIDLAVAVIVGGAFNKIVSSLVNDVVMPLLGLILGNVNFKTLSFVLKEAVGDEPALTLNYGMFIQNVVDFLIIAFVIFMALKAMSSLKKKEEVKEVKVEEPKPSKEEILLTEIRDLLKNK